MTARLPSLPLFDQPQPWQTEIYRKRLALSCAGQTQFTRDFAPWLEANWKVWEAFEREANKVWDSGRRHYSARTIGEYLRHQTTLSEKPNEHGFKLNDHAWPNLSRLYLLMYPARDGFFERRLSPAMARSS